jgi:thiol-disulfide isomerase/thioredoxin
LSNLSHGLSNKKNCQAAAMYVCCYKTISIMKLITLLLLFHHQAPTVPKSLVEMSGKLNALTSVSYHLQRDINNKKDNYFDSFAGDSYVEFSQHNKQQISRFQFTSEKFTQIYNGTEFFTLDKVEKTYDVKELPETKSFKNLSSFYNSIQTLRSMLEQIMTNDSIGKKETDTLLGDRRYKMVTLSMHRSSLEYMGNSMPFTKDIILFYKLIIDPVTYLPFQIIQSNNLGDGYFTRTTFTNIQTAPKAPGEFSWFYTTYKKDYRPKAKAENTLLIATGSSLPDWSLPDFSNRGGAKLQKNDFEGKLVLMDFWIKNCGSCMESFPHLQALQKKYGSAGFQLLAVNAYDKEEDIAFFYKRERPVYKMLYEGRAFAKQMGVESNGYPTVILTDKQGKIIYSGNFDFDKLEKLIKEHI